MGVILCEFESRPPHSISQEEILKEVSSFSVYTDVEAGFLLYSESDILAQRKITVVLQFHPPKATFPWTEE